jgi:hypothetical protein
MPENGVSQTNIRLGIRFEFCKPFQNWAGDKVKGIDRKKPKAGKANN